MEPQALQHLTTNDLSFIGEGNEHLVFSITNSDSVLRFRKVLPGDVISREEFMHRVENDMRFTNGVAGLLAGPLLTDEAMFIVVDPCLLKKVMKEIKELRDAKRLHKTINPFGLGIITPNGATKFVSRRLSLTTNRAAILTVSQRRKSYFTLNKYYLCVYSQNTYDVSSQLVAGSVLASECSEISPQNLQESQNRLCNILAQSKSSRMKPFICQMRSTRLDSSKGIGVDGAFQDTSLVPNQKSNATTNEQILQIAKTDQHRDNHIGTRSEQSAFAKSEKICVELKPKQGFLEPFCLEGSLCRFCLKQYVKVKNKIESSRSAYCPQDLYSGDPILMKKALRGLFSSPQNNLKIFSNGSIVHDFSKYCYISDLIAQILVYELGNSTLQQKNAKFHDSSSELINKSSPFENSSYSSVENSDFSSVENSDFSSVSSECKKNEFESYFKSSKLKKINSESQKANKEEFNALSFRSQSKNLGIIPSISDSKLNYSKAQTGQISNNVGENEFPKITFIGSHTEDDICNYETSSDVPYSYFPSSSMLSPSSILGRVLQIQYLGQISELQAAIFYKELSRRFSSIEDLNQRIANFHFLNEDVHRKIVGETNKQNMKNKFNLGKNALGASGQVNTTNQEGDIELLDSSYLIQLVQQALIAMSFKDLSIMIFIEGPCKITHLATDAGSPFWLEHPPGSGSWFKCQVTLVDLALKCPQKIFEHEYALYELKEILMQLQKEGKEPFCCKSKINKRKL